jgi:hypothetical protein
MVCRRSGLRVVWRCCFWSCTSGFEWFAPSCRPPRTGSRDISKWAGIISVGALEGTAAGSLGLAFAGLFGAPLRAIDGFRAFTAVATFAVFAVFVAARAFTRFGLLGFLARELAAVGFALAFALGFAFAVLARAFVELALLAVAFLALVFFFAPALEPLTFFFFACMIPVVAQHVPA